MLKPATDEQLDKRLMRAQRALQRLSTRSGPRVSRRRRKLAFRIVRLVELRAMAMEDRPKALQVTPRGLAALFERVGAVLPPPVGPVVTLIASGVEAVSAVKKAAKDGDMAGAFDSAESFVGKALRDAGFKDQDVEEALDAIAEFLGDTVEDSTTPSDRLDFEED